MGEDEYSAPETGTAPRAPGAAARRAATPGRRGQRVGRAPGGARRPGAADDLKVLAERARRAPDRAEARRLLALADDGGRPARDELARVLVEPGRELWARELAACALGFRRDSRSFETLVFLLNYRDPASGALAARALARLGDPRTARAAAALAANALRTAYALHPVRLLARLNTPETVPVLVSTLDRLLTGPERHWPVALACVEELGRLGDERAAQVLIRARDFSQLRAAAGAAVQRLPAGTDGSRWTDGDGGR